MHHISFCFFGLVFVFALFCRIDWSPQCSGSLSHYFAVRLQLLPGLFTADTTHDDLISIMGLLSGGRVLESLDGIGLDSLLEVGSPKSSSDLVGDYMSALVSLSRHSSLQVKRIETTGTRPRTMEMVPNLLISTRLSGHRWRHTRCKLLASLRRRHFASPCRSL